LRQCGNNLLHDWRTDAVAEQVNAFPPGPARQFELIVDSHSAFQLWDLQHTHHRAVARTLHQREAIDRRYRS
jgi:hypothetical protein